MVLNKNLKGCFIDQSKGSYVLLVRLPEEQTITIGKLQDVYFRRGYYAYVGSAMSGVKSRLSRHLKSSKKLHWHIDYLLERASIVAISICETKDRAECTIVRLLSSQFDYVAGFGSSDCHCRSHLFFAAEEKQMKTAIRSTLKSLAVPAALAVI